jgi:hypothetical protein
MRRIRDYQSISCNAANIVATFLFTSKIILSIAYS